MNNEYTALENLDIENFKYTNFKFNKKYKQLLSNIFYNKKYIVIETPPVSLFKQKNKKKEYILYFHINNELFIFLNKFDKYIQSILDKQYTYKSPLRKYNKKNYIKIQVPINNGNLDIKIYDDKSNEININFKKLSQEKIILILLLKHLGCSNNIIEPQWKLKGIIKNNIVDFDIFQLL